MADTENNLRVLELTTAITITALETGHLDASNAETVAKFCYTVALSMCEALQIDDKVIAAQYMNRHVVNPK